MFNKSFIITLTLLIQYININIIKSDLSPDNIVVAINCGGEEYKDSKDINFEADKYFDNGQSSDFGTQFEIKNTYDHTPYQTERWSEKDFSYKIPVEGNGKYVLILKFSEVYFNSPNEKVFNILFGKREIVKEIDVYQKVGKSTAYDEYVEFEIKNNKVYFNNKVAEYGYTDSNELNLIFQKGEKDNPKINAIVLVKGNLSDTDYDQFKNQIEELEKEKMEKERKQREIKKRNNLHYDFEDFEEDFIDPDIEAKSRSGFGAMFYVISGLIVLVVYMLVFKGKKEEDDEEHEKED